eukprot:5931085-Amphidinium_carterae.1
MHAARLENHACTKKQLQPEHRIDLGYMHVCVGSCWSEAFFKQSGAPSRFRWFDLIAQLPPLGMRRAQMEFGA